MNETPPVAVTPGEDGSDFYNTPFNAGTPLSKDVNKEDVAKVSTAAEPTASQPAPLIPGLNLVNDNLHDLQSNSESIPAQTTEDTDMTEGNEVANAKSEPQHAVDQKDAQQKQEGATNELPDANSSIKTTANAAEAAPATEAAQNEEDEHPEWEVDSSPYESSSDDTTDSSDDDSDEDEDYPILSAEEQARILMQAELGSDDEGDGKGKSGGHIKTANEILEDAPPIPDVTVTPDMKVVHLGHVQTIVENNVLIEANVSGEYQVLEGGSLLCDEQRKIVGVVCETLGRVENPLYTVRYESIAAMEERGISKGQSIFYVEQHSSFVFTQPLKGMKGSDASNFHDEEIAEDEVEFSDDETEADYKRKLKQKRQEKKDARRGDGGPARGRRGPPGPSRLNQTELNYDDDAGEDGYTPLARPKNLHEIMGQGEAPVEGDGPSATRGSGFRGGRGRGRGSDRGRGGRGRGGPRGQGSYHDRRPYPHDSQAQSQPQQQPQPQPQHPYTQTPYQQNQPPAFGIPQQQPPFNFPQQQQQQQQPYPQAQSPIPFQFQMPYLQGIQQQANPYQQMPPNPQFNPQLVLAALHQQQAQRQLYQQQYLQQQPQVQQAPAQAQGSVGQPPAINFDQVRAQLNLLQQWGNGNQGQGSSRPPQ
ncbi:RNA-binding snoRNP assembly protein NAF1 [Aspergillus ruber CBS 135680]|uniref:H/ACA ribonucleoprotein complex non-core subunit NAF1 n=1 Tax=Aspergillus ruber (strain CBS 135680) TaxID=1388766 RepID=A0A017SS90_ASPRC|nr:NAF1-domain-containing protein [Aspergillus ruber CBS 135680]EYE99125.1 NAF1-domain-containing protein [Aspergillus ruber CBS 135680]